MQKIAKRKKEHLTANKINVLKVDETESDMLNVSHFPTIMIETANYNSLSENMSSLAPMQMNNLVMVHDSTKSETQNN